MNGWKAVAIAQKNICCEIFRIVRAIHYII